MVKNENDRLMIIMYKQSMLIQNDLGTAG